MSVVKQTAKVIKKTGAQAARQIVREPVEILKTASSQVLGQEKPVTGESEQIGAKNEEINPQEEKERKQKLQVQGARQLAALEAELADIKSEKEGLSKQEKQEEEIREAQESQALKMKPELKVSSKPSRKFGWGKKLKEEQRRVEVPKPPSG